MFYLAVIFRTSGLEDSISSNPKRTALRKQGEESDYIEVCNKRHREGSGTPLQYSCLENPWMEEPGGLQSMRLLRVGHD